MRVRNKKRCATAGLEGVLEVLLGLRKIEVVVQIRGRHVRKRLAVPGIVLQDLFQTGNRFVILLTINQIANGTEG